MTVRERTRKELCIRSVINCVGMQVPDDVCLMVVDPQIDARPAPVLVLAPFLIIHQGEDEAKEWSSPHNARRHGQVLHSGPYRVWRAPFMPRMGQIAHESDCISCSVRELAVGGTSIDHHGPSHGPQSTLHTFYDSISFLAIGRRHFVLQACLSAVIVDPL